MVLREWISAGEEMIVSIDDKYLLRQKDSERFLPLDRATFFSEITRILSSFGIPELGVYALNAPDSEDRISLYEDGIFWVVSYCERGRRVSPAFFDDPYDAGNYFVWKLISEETRSAQFPRVISSPSTPR